MLNNERCDNNQLKPVILIINFIFFPCIEMRKSCPKIYIYTAQNTLRYLRMLQDVPTNLFTIQDYKC